MSKSLIGTPVLRFWTINYLFIKKSAIRKMSFFYYLPFSGIAPCVGTTGKWYRQHTPTKLCPKALGLLVITG